MYGNIVDCSCIFFCSDTVQSESLDVYIIGRLEDVAASMHINGEIDL